MSPPAVRRAVPYVLGALVVAASLAAAVVLYGRFGVSEIGYGARGFVVGSDQLVQVSFEVRRAEPATPALCTVRARDTTGAEVGAALVRVPPSDRTTVVVSHDLVTTGRANTGEVTGCSLERAP